MAISNSIGSNIFDILVCLALPWFISTVIIDTNSFVKIYSGGILYSVIILLSTVVALVVLVSGNKFIMTKKLGLILFILWIIVTVVQCLFELDIFGDFSLPLCS
jgi:Ca2+/Na+ antiporter